MAETIDNFATVVGRINESCSFTDVSPTFRTLRGTEVVIHSTSAKHSVAVYWQRLDPKMLSIVQTIEVADGLVGDSTGGLATGASSSPSSMA